MKMKTYNQLVLRMKVCVDGKVDLHSVKVSGYCSLKCLWILLN